MDMAFFFGHENSAIPCARASARAAALFFSSDKTRARLMASAQARAADFCLLLVGLCLECVGMPKNMLEGHFSQGDAQATPEAVILSCPRQGD
jgi:hypothetical protein